jgi:hypothetical protein
MSTNGLKYRILTRLILMYLLPFRSTVMFDSYHIVGDLVFPEIPSGPEAEKEIAVCLTNLGYILCNCPYTGVIT